jgi:hypothetical protein
MNLASCDAREQTKVTSTSAENMERLGDVVGHLQESGEAVDEFTASFRMSSTIKQGRSFLAAKLGRGPPGFGNKNTA